MINAKTLNEMFLDCLFKADEIVDDKPIIEPLIVEGVLGSFGFHAGRVKIHETEIIAMLKEMQPEFFKSTGGGWSFLNLCQDRNGNQWTDFHKTVNELICLGIAIKKVRYLLPREMWDCFPGGMPYVQIEDL